MAKLDYQVEIPLTEADSDMNWLQFIANHEMQSSLPDNLFGNAFEDTSFSALLQQTNIVSETFSDEDMNMEADLQKHQDCVAVTANLSKGNLAVWSGIVPPVAASSFSTFPSDAALLERAVKYSSFANGNNNCQIMKTPAVKTEESSFNNSKEGPSRSDSPKALKSSTKKSKNAQSSKTVDSEAKRCKGVECTVKDFSQGKVEKNNDECAKSALQKSEEDRKNSLPEKSNYIHVRARRGQATDSHSLAERVRREKISERMKLLQDLVPGCSRITGKALMLDEIINHVQSLQRQVEFLSMKLATVNRPFDFDIDRVFAKEMMTSGAGIPPQLTASPYVQYQQPEPTSTDLSSAWNGPFHNAYALGFHPTRIQPSQAIPGMLALNHMMKREI